MEERVSTTIQTLPTTPGHYWARWRIKSPGTAEEDDAPSGMWEIVQVFQNCIDETDDEWLMVAVPGVERSQSIQDFFWGDGPIPLPSQPDRRRRGRRNIRNDEAMMPAPGHEIGRRNLERVREYFRAHLCATNVECAEAIGLSVEAVGRHVATIRSEWQSHVGTLSAEPTEAA